MKITLLEHCYEVEPMLAEDFSTLDRWIALEADGTWEAKDNGVEGEWLAASPSLFFREKIGGDFLWQIDVTRLPTDAAFLDRYRQTKWGRCDPAEQYNFNFWLRADVPDDGPGGAKTAENTPANAPAKNFFDEYPKYLKTGWNGMGDDHWRSYFNTVVWNPEANWVRLRRGPGYEMKEDVHDVAPFFGYHEKHRFTFAIRGGRIRCYVDETRLVYDHLDPNPYRSGYIGLCVWLCKTRFENMRLFRILG